jgi:hypothetical protein
MRKFKLDELKQIATLSDHARDVVSELINIMYKEELMVLINTDDTRRMVRAQGSVRSLGSLVVAFEDFHELLSDGAYREDYSVEE